MSYRDGDLAVPRSGLIQGTTDEVGEIGFSNAERGTVQRYCH